MGEASGEGAIYPGGGARESLNGLCGEVEMTIHGKPQVMRAHPHRSEGRTEGGNEGVEGGGIVGWRGREAEERLRDANPWASLTSWAATKGAASQDAGANGMVGRRKNEGGEEPRHIGR